MFLETSRWCWSSRMCLCTEKIPLNSELDSRENVLLDRNEKEWSQHMHGNMEEGVISVLWLWRVLNPSPSTRGVVSGVGTWVSQAWLAPGQTEMKSRTVHAINTKREKSQEGEEARQTWGSGVWYLKQLQRKGKWGSSQGGRSVKQICWPISQ